MKQFNDQFTKIKPRDEKIVVLDVRPKKYINKLTSIDEIDLKDTFLKLKKHSL